MVVGLDIFKKYFEQYPDNYIIIGGIACDIIIGEAGFTPRANRDIDIILIAEALSTEFVQQFWKFIKEGDYGDREKSTDKHQYYRFKRPKNKDFPFHLFSIEIPLHARVVIFLENCHADFPYPG